MNAPARTAPRWMPIARAQLGVREVPGPASSPRILGWAKAVARWLGIPYTADATPWCGLFAAWAVSMAGLIPPKIAVRAKSWATWGEESTPCEGAILVFERQGGGHVGFYVGETEGDEGAYLVLGGNQADSVCEAWLAKKRCIAVRMPVGYQPGPRIIVHRKGGQLSRNES